MKFVKLFLLIILLLIPFAIFASEVNEYKLANGLKILIIEEHKAPVATFQVWYRVGSREEPAGKSGLSHLLEHMMFKDTRQGAKSFSRIVQKHGGIDNAYTTKDYTVYFEVFSSDRITLSVNLETDRMQNLTINQKDTLLEKEVVMEERRLRYEDDPQNALFEEVVSASFKVHPYRRPVIGWMSDIESIGKEDIYHHYKTFCTPDNAVIVIAGDVKADVMIKKIKDSFGNIPSGPTKKSIKFSEPTQQGEKRIYLKKEAELPYLLIAYHVPNFPHDDSYALDVLSLILSSGESSRLYQSLVYKRQIALDVDTYYSGFSRDPYLFFFDATAFPGKDIKEVEDALYKEIEKIKKELLSEREVQKAKNQIESHFLMGQDSIYQQAMKYGMFEMLGDWRLIDTYLKGIRKVSPEEVVKVAKQYLRKDNRTVGILIPVKAKK